MPNSPSICEKSRDLPTSRIPPVTKLLPVDSLLAKDGVADGEVQQASGDRRQFCDIHLSTSTFTIESTKSSKSSDFNYLTVFREPPITSIESQEKYIYRDLNYTDNEFDASTREAQSRREEWVLTVVSALTFLFIVAELTGGYLAHSLAIMTDAFHMLSDLSSFLISIAAIHLSRWPPTAKYPFGYQRAEVLGALASILTIWLLTIVLVYMAIVRIIEADYGVDADVMLVTSAAGVMFNLVIGGLLIFDQKHHMKLAVEHKTMHTTHYKNSAINDSEFCQTASVEKADGSKKSQNILEINLPQRDTPPRVSLNIRAACVHVLGDLVQSIGVLVAALTIKFFGFALADPICTFLFSILVLMTTITVIGDIVGTLMEAVPSHIDVDRIRQHLVVINGVVDVHSMRIWALKSDYTAITLHLNVTGDANKINEAVDRAYATLKRLYSFQYICIEAQCQKRREMDTRKNGNKK